MAELEIHAGHEHSNDDFGRRVGVMVGIIGIILAVVTISSHRAHTAAVIERTKANDQWSFYQAKKLRQHLADVGAGLASSLATDPARVEKLVESLNKDKERYAHETDEIQKEANAKENESDHEEQRAVWLDLGEGFLELGLVLSSLYFLSKRRFFPVFGGLAALIGLGLGVYGYIV
jgi:Domain of unknown function (DUF4337)